MACCRLQPLVWLGVLVMGLSVCACQGAAPSAWLKVHPTISAQVTVVTVPYSEQEIRQRQQGVDQGHLALSISEPAYTAMDYLASHFSEFGKVEKPPQYIKVVRNKMAVVEIESGDKKYIVTLKKLARQDETGAWFVTKIAIRPLKVSHPSETRIPGSSSTLQPASTLTEETRGATTVAITGTVQDVMRSARVIVLQEPAKGFLYVALTQEARLLSPAGQPITLQDLAVGMRIRATVRPGDEGTLLAEEVQLLP